MDSYAASRFKQAWNAMTGTQKTLKRTRRKLFSFNQLVKSWKREHEEAREADFDRLQKKEVEIMLEDACKLWHDIEELHAEWIEMVVEGTVEPSLEFDKRIYHLYVNWHTTAAAINSVLQMLECLNVQFAHTKQFRECLEESNEIIVRIGEPTTAMRPIPDDARELLAANVDMSRYE